MVSRPESERVPVGKMKKIPNLKSKALRTHAGSQTKRQSFRQCHVKCFMEIKVRVKASCDDRPSRNRPIVFSKKREQKRADLLRVGFHVFHSRGTEWDW